MRADMVKDRLIACICEGGAETAIMDILLDYDLLIFNREQLIDEHVIPRISVKDFERRYLRREYDQKIIVLRIIDSRGENFDLSKEYRHQVDVIDVITAPEIEMLIIAGQGKYDDFCRSKIKKPSDYCKSILKIKNVKKPEYIKEYFADTKFLLKSIKEYNRIHGKKKKKKRNETVLFDLLKNKNLLN